MSEPGVGHLMEPHQEVTIEVKVTISGEWVTPELIADTACSLADALGSRLRNPDVGVTLDVTP